MKKEDHIMAKKYLRLEKRKKKDFVPSHPHSSQILKWQCHQIRMVWKWCSFKNIS
jgi:hypothetical protein